MSFPRLTTHVPPPITSKLLLTLLVGGLFVLGCASIRHVGLSTRANHHVDSGPHQPVYAPAEPPAWYLAPPRDTESWLHGVGSSSQLPAAKSLALVDVASKLATSVRATLRDRQVLNNDGLDQQIELELVAQVRNREFQAYEVLEVELIDDAFYALVRVDRSRLILDTLAALRELERDLEARLGRAAQATPLAYYLAFRDAEPSLDLVDVSVELLSTLSPAFDERPSRQRSREYRAHFERAREHAVVALLPDSESTRVAGVVQELLAGARLHSTIASVESASRVLCESLCVEITSEWSRLFAARRYITTLTATFRVRNGAGSVASARSHRVKATALTGYPEADIAAAARLREQLSREGILPAVGLGSENLLVSR